VPLLLEEEEEEEEDVFKRRRRLLSSTAIPNWTTRRTCFRTTSEICKWLRASPFRPVVERLLLIRGRRVRLVAILPLMA